MASLPPAFPVTDEPMDAVVDLDTSKCLNISLARMLHVEPRCVIDFNVGPGHIPCPAAMLQPRERGC